MAPVTAGPARLVRRYPLAAVLLGAAGLRLLVWLWCLGEPLHPGDEEHYHELAVHLVREGRFILEGQPCSMRPPLYPLFVAGVYACFGVGSFQAVRAAQMLLGLATAATAFVLGRQLYGRRVGLWAAGLTAFYPPLVAIACFLYSETLFAFWVTLMGACVVRATRGGGLGAWAAAGALLGLAALTRSVLWLFPPVLAVFALIAWRASLPRRLGAAALVVACFAAVIAPWAVRSSRLEKTFVAVDVMGGRNLMMGNYDYTPTFRAWDAISVEGEESWYRVLRRDHPEFPTLTQGQRDKLALRYGVRYMLEHPGQTALRSLVKFFNFWQLDRTAAAALDRGWFGALPRPAVLALTALICGSYAAAMLAAVCGVVLLPPRDRRAMAFLLLLVGFVCALHSAVFAHSRYHLPLAPVELVFAAAAVVHVAGRVFAPAPPASLPERERVGRGRIGLAAAACLVLVAGWVWEIAAVDLPKVLGVLGR